MPSPLPDLPEIPPEVYESRDRGELVLFCGAGVSKNAGWPPFGELACWVEGEFGPAVDHEQVELDAKLFDAYLQLVEERVDGGTSHGCVGKFVRDMLREKQTDPDVHESVLVNDFETPDM